MADSDQVAAGITKFFFSVISVCFFVGLVFFGWLCEKP